MAVDEADGLDGGGGVAGGGVDCGGGVQRGGGDPEQHRVSVGDRSDQAERLRHEHCLCVHRSIVLLLLLLTAILTNLVAAVLAV